MMSSSLVLATRDVSTTMLRQPDTLSLYVSDNKIVALAKLLVFPENLLGLGSVDQQLLLQPPMPEPLLRLSPLLLLFKGNTKPLRRIGSRLQQLVACTHGFPSLSPRRLQLH
jgi:hypothetical protein